MLRVELAEFAKRAGCTDTSRITPHRLRHTWASDMLRCGISLPALKELMGHKDIRMTLRYLKITQPDYIKGTAAISRSSDPMERVMWPFPVTSSSRTI